MPAKFWYRITTGRRQSIKWLTGMDNSSEFEDQLTVAIIGDPHFHVEHDAGGTSISHIRLRPSGEFLHPQEEQNPWEGLKTLLQKENVTADLLVCVGDMTVAADEVGLKKAWTEMQTLGVQLCAKHVVSATGNHDVSSRSNAELVAKNPVRAMSAIPGMFESLKLLDPAYPIVEIKDGQPVENKLLRTKYFGDSLVMIEDERYRLLVLNSCCEHGSDAFQYERGSFPKSAQAALLEELRSTAPKINILVCHHPPEPHTEHDLGGHDFIENGEALIRSLEQHGSWFIIHGHKHHGRIGYAKGTGSGPVVFAAASLGYYVDVSRSGMRNQFYCVTVHRKSNGRLLGKVTAWDWNLGIGWHKATPKRGGIFDGCGFGYRQPPEDLAEAISKMPIPCAWGEVVNAMPQLAYLTPDDRTILRNRLQCLYQIEIEPDDDGYWSELARVMI
jgi:hypothetical protein